MRSSSSLANFFALVAILRDTENLWENFIAAHTYQGAHALEGDRVALFRHRLDPGVCVGIVAVNERAINIKNDAVSLCNRFLPVYFL